MADFDSGFGGKAFDGVQAGDIGNFRAGAGSEDEIFGGDFFVADGYGVAIEKIGEAVKTNNVGVFVDFFVVATGLFDNNILMGSNSGIVEGKLLIPELGIGKVFGKVVGKIESSCKRYIAGIEVAATVRAAFNYADAFFGFG